MTLQAGMINLGLVLPNAGGDVCTAHGCFFFGVEIEQMSKLLLLPFGSVTLSGVGIGVASALAFRKFGRPMMVETLKLGYEAKDGTMRLFHDARQMASDVRDEAEKKAAKKVGRATA